MAIEVIGHRGARGLLPELSLAGFAKALELGVDGIELDVGITKDLKVVAYHDFALNPDITRFRNGKWLKGVGPKICELSLQELQNYDIGRIHPKSNYAKIFRQQKPLDGCPIPTLEEIAELAARHGRTVKYCIEPKRHPIYPHLTVDINVFAETLVAEIDRLKITEKSIVHTFDWNLLDRIKELQPKLAQWHLTSELEQFNTVADRNNGSWTAGLMLSDFGNSVPKMIQSIGGSVWSSNFEALTVERIEEANRLGLKVCCWTVNNDSEFEFLTAAGVAGITTDYPNRLIQHISEFSSH